MHFLGFDFLKSDYLLSFVGFRGLLCQWGLLHHRRYVHSSVHQRWILCRLECCCAGVFLLDQVDLSQQLRVIRSQELLRLLPSPR